MSRLHRYVLSVAALLWAPMVVIAQSSVQRTITIHADEIVADSPARTVADRLAQVDTAIRCRIVSSEVRVRETAVPPGVDPIYGKLPETEFKVVLLEAIKDSDKLAVIGFPMTVLAPAGDIVVDGVRIVKGGDRFPTFAGGEEAVFLLKWSSSSGEFKLASGDDWFLLTQAGILTSARAPYSDAQRGVPVAQFLARVRAAAASHARR